VEAAIWYIARFWSCAILDCAVLRRGLGFAQFWFAAKVRNSEDSKADSLTYNKKMVIIYLKQKCYSTEKQTILVFNSSNIVL